MKKLLSEEKHGLRLVCRNSKIFFFILLLSNSSFSQIPLNGFCKLDKFSVPGGFTKIFPLNYNKDFYTDLLLFNPLNKETLLLTGEANLKFSDAKKINFPFEPNAFKPVYDSLNQLSHYAFTSRKSRLAGILNFDDKGNPQIISSARLNHFPDEIDVADIDGNIYYLVSGKSFDGLSLFTIRDGKFLERKVFSGSAFSFAQFLHLNSDGVIDILAYNIFDKSIYFLINNGRNEFAISRKIPLSTQINYLQIYDLNGDSYADIIYSERNYLRILYGEPLYLFEKMVTLETEFPVDNISIADYNHDGLFDLLTISRTSNTISVFYSKDNGSFYSEIKYLKSDGIEFSVPFFSRFVYGSAYITIRGELGIISELRSFKEDVTLVPSVNPEELVLFDFNDDGIKDYAFIDASEKQLNFILRNDRGIPSVYYSINLFSECNRMEIFKRNRFEKIFYCYSQNRRHIEILYINFSEFNFTRETLYADGLISDLKITPSAEQKPNIHILYEGNNKLKYGLFSYSSIKYLFINYPEISSSWLDALIVNPFTNKVAYWSETNDEFKLALKEFGTKSTEEEVIYRFSTESFIKVLSVAKTISEESFIYASLIVENFRVRFLSLDRTLAVYSRRDPEKKLRAIESEHLAFDNDNLLYLYSQYSGNFNRVLVNRAYNRLSISKIFDEVNIKKFVVDKLDIRNKHVIYIDSTDNLIKVKKLSG